jgi:ArsR family transcriptional regulator
VADLGCGTGAIVQQLAPHVRQVIGVDNSQEMLDAARHRLAGAQNVALECADLVKLPLAGESVDAALMVLSLSYAADVPQALSEARRIVRPGTGRLILVDVLEHDRDDFRRQMGQARMGFSLAELSRLLAAAGFTPATPRVLQPESQVKGPALVLVRATA